MPYSKPENIRKNILLPYFAIIFSMTLLFSLSLFWLTSDQSTKGLNQTIKTYKSAYQNALSNESNTLLGLNELLIRDEKLIQLWQSGNRRELYDHVTSVYALLQQLHTITHFYFHQPDKQVFFRVHRPSDFGDPIDRYTLNQATQTKKSSAGIEIGTFGQFVLRAVTPVFNGENLLGYIELGKEIDEISDMLANTLSVDLVYMVDKANLDKTQYENYIQQAGINTQWGDYEKRVVISSSLTNPKSILVPSITNQAAAQKQILDIETNNKHFHARWEPLYDTSKTQVGAALILQNVTRIDQETARILTIILITVIILTIVSSLFYLRYIGSLEFRLENLVSKLRSEINNHQKTTQLLRRSNKRLHHINAELESYSYSLAHDLRTPLRAITSFSEILLTDTRKKLDSEEQGYLKRVVNAGKRMSLLIEDILQLARIAREDFKPETVNLSHLVHHSVEQLKIAYPDRQIDIKITENITCQGSPSLLSLLIDNLIGNAWKYTSFQEHASVEFGMEERDNKRVYYVKDNGIGIDSRYLDKLFKPFYRIASDEKFEGTGIGLAICKRVVEQHHGDIWVESQLNRGTTFMFTLELESELSDGEMQST